VLHGLGACPRADFDHCRFAFLSFQSACGNLDQLVRAEGAVDFRMHLLGQTFPAEDDDRFERVCPPLESLAFGRRELVHVRKYARRSPMLTA
jgi:hypothetical protein